MKFLFSFFIASFFILFVFISYVDAATYYVSPTGSNTNPGTLTQPFKSIQKAIDTVSSPGVVVFIFVAEDTILRLIRSIRTHLSLLPTRTVQQAIPIIWNRTLERGQ